uniref:Hydrophobin n=1 Tax=Ganoderma boninense TaxID=34458 RepID=A0A5K1JSQ9_9APHY|nr:Hydrophobin-like protein MPG1 [Ganoderma boninense]
MFSRAVAFTTLALPLLAVATPVELVARQSCSTGAVQCCNSTVEANSASGNLLLGLLGIVLGDITGLIGLNCSPLTVIGVGSGNACSAQAVCCTNNNVGGLISIGCVPITL